MNSKYNQLISFHSDLCPLTFNTSSIALLIYHYKIIAATIVNDQLHKLGNDDLVGDQLTFTTATRRSNNRDPQHRLLILTEHFQKRCKYAARVLVLSIRSIRLTPCLILSLTYGQVQFLSHVGGIPVLSHLGRVCIESLYIESYSLK